MQPADDIRPRLAERQFGLHSSYRKSRERSPDSGTPSERKAPSWLVRIRRKHVRLSPLLPVRLSRQLNCLPHALELLQALPDSPEAATQTKDLKDRVPTLSTRDRWIAD